ncbi:LysE family translocator [Pseudoalteromonas sp. R3]|uniref:LysE family translocator n=1 Tax=Pseudoalteromonas sp. R3 TaxID=1709477 RepID=UPI0006B52F6A|nr:LysE family translocator [Pseudoalteromonas sp. R3]AZZ97406.1 LysE family translocator [Pseudoalteromonas sp. R3]
MEIANWLAFLSIAVAATITPGPAVFLVISHSMTAGWRQATYTILGNVTGLFVMSLCSVLGVSAIIVGSSMLFSIIKVLGAVYLLYMGIRLWRKGLVYRQAGLQQRKSDTSYFGQGIVICLTNPKAIVFTTALFPQFVTVNQPLAPQFMVLVSTLLICSFVCLSLYAKWGEEITNKLSGKILAVISRCLGLTFMGAAAAMFLSFQRRV